MGGWVIGIASRAGVLGASAVAHVAVLAVAYGGGHGGGAKPPAPTSAAAEIAIELMPPAPLTAPDADHADAREPARARPHTHAYPVPFDHDAHPHDPAIVHAAAAPHASEPSVAQASSVASAPAPATAHFTMTIAAGSIAYGAVGAAGDRDPEHGNAASGEANGDDGAPVAASVVTVPARRVYAPTPSYPPEARSAGVEGDVPVEIVIDTRGVVIEARALRQVGFGLSDAAVANVRLYRFTPAERAGRLVRVRMTIPVRFQLD